MCMRVCVHTRTCQHLHTPLPTTAEEQKRGRASFQNQSTWKNGCGSTKPGLNQQWADCLATVTNDLMWKTGSDVCRTRATRRLHMPDNRLLGGQVAPQSLGSACGPVN